MRDKQELRNDILSNNPWKVVTDKMRECIRTKSYSDKEFVCLGDKEFIASHNRVYGINSEYHYFSDVIPYAYSGNILDAKVVILTLNPGYVEFVNKTIVEKLLNDKALEDLYQGRINDLELVPDRMIASDVDNLIGDRYWDKKLSFLWKDDPGNLRDKYLKQIALMQFIPYHSEAYKSSKRLGTRESDEHRNKIIEYLVNHTECLFIISRAKSEWQQLLEGASDRVLYLDNARNTTISSNNLKNSGNGYNRIIEALNKK
ncbi:MAG: hypothetical protein SNH27_14555 [Rikenellaceae bacterium]